MSSQTPEWTNKIAAWRNSGLSVAAWCREKLANLDVWHREKSMHLTSVFSVVANL